MPDYDQKIRAFKRRQRKIIDKKKRLDKSIEDKPHEEYYRMKINPRDIELIMEQSYDRD